MEKEETGEEQCNAGEIEEGGESSEDEGDEALDETMEEEEEEEMAVDLNFEAATGEDDEKDGNNKNTGAMTLEVCSTDQSQRMSWMETRE